MYVVKPTVLMIQEEQAGTEAVLFMRKALEEIRNLLPEQVSKQPETLVINPFSDFLRLTDEMIVLTHDLVAINEEAMALPDPKKPWILPWS